MAKEIKINKYRVLDRNRGGFTVEAKKCDKRFEKIGLLQQRFNRL